MPQAGHVYGTPLDEEKWSRAKEIAAKEGHTEEWDYIMAIYKQMSHSGEYQHKNIRERKKKKMTVSTWREKHPKWKESARRSAEKSMVDLESIQGYHKHIRLTLLKGPKIEFRCGACKALLLKGSHLEKSFIEIKCRRCGCFNINRAS